MNKQELVRQIAARAEITKKEAEEALTATVSAISDALESGDKVKLAGFGTFSVYDRPARNGRSPATGKTIAIPATRTAKFKAGIKLAELVNN